MIFHKRLILFELMNDLWEVNVQDDKFALISKMNEECNVKVKTPVGETDEFKLKEVEMQGTVLAPIKCSVMMDSIGRYCYTFNKGIFIYKTSVFIPPIWMIDDCLTFSSCSNNVIIINEIINSRVKMKKLKFNTDKCFKMHVGRRKTEDKCPKIRVHDEEVKSSSEIKYLGDWVSPLLNNKRNIDERVNKSIGTTSQILSLLRQVSLGFHFVEIGLIFRESMLVSKLIFNAEVWVNIRKEELNKLTSGDESYLIKILGLKRTVMKESLYTETGKYPIKYLIMQRKIMYLRHLLKREKKELISRVLSAQIYNTETNDWYGEVREDMNFIDVQLSNEEVEKMQKKRFKVKD